MHSNGPPVSQCRGNKSATRRPEANFTALLRSLWSFGNSKVPKIKARKRPKNEKYSAYFGDKDIVTTPSTVKRIVCSLY